MWKLVLVLYLVSNGGKIEVEFNGFESLAACTAMEQQFTVFGHSGAAVNPVEHYCDHATHSGG